MPAEEFANRTETVLIGSEGKVMSVWGLLAQLPEAEDLFLYVGMLIIIGKFWI